MVFLLGTMLSTLSTGEHYVVDLIAGLVFGCFAGAVAGGFWRRAFVYLFATAVWSVSIRFRYETLLAHPYALRLFALVTVMIAMHAVLVAWDRGPVGSFLKLEEIEKAAADA